MDSLMKGQQRRKTIISLYYFRAKQPNPTGKCREWKEIDKQCCDGCSDECSLHGSKVDFCASKVITTICNFDHVQYLQHCCNNTWRYLKVAEITNMVWLGGMNPYDLYQDCWHDNSSSRSRREATTIQTRYRADVYTRLGDYPEKLRAMLTNRPPKINALRKVACWYPFHR